MDRYMTAKKKAMKTSCIYNGNKYLVEDFINDKDLIFIAFYYDEKELETYYQLPYVRMCMDSWKKYYPESKILFIQMVPYLSEFSDATYYYGKRNYPTDSQRVLYCSILRKAIYLDVDVFLPEKIKEIEEDNFPRACVINNCSGTGLYSNNYDLRALHDLYNWYESTAVKRIKNNVARGIPIERGISDVEAIAANPYFPNVNSPVDHFSYAYPVFRDKKTFRIVDSGKDCSIVFHKASYEAFLEYIKYKHYDKYLKEDGEIPIAFI